MHWYRPLPMPLWWGFSAGVVLASAYVLVFLARHPVDGESRIMDWSHRNRVPLLLSGGVTAFVMMPNTIVLAALLGLCWWIVRSSQSWQHDQSAPRRGAQYY